MGKKGFFDLSKSQNSEEIFWPKGLGLIVNLLEILKHQKIFLWIK